MTYQESNLQTDFNRWLRHNWKGGAAAFELKITKKDSLSFSQVKGHQEQALLDAKHGVLAYKISDDSMYGGYRPFDSFVMSNTPAYLVFMFYKTRGRKLAYWIDIDAWLKFKGNKMRGSISEEQAYKIADRVIDLNDTNKDKLINEYDIQ